MFIDYKKLCISGLFLLFITIITFYIIIYINNSDKNYYSLRWDKVLETMKTYPPLQYSESSVVFLLSYSYKDFPEYYYYNREILKLYCSRYNYTLLEKNHSMKNDISPYWLRVKDLLDMTNEYPKNTLFVYLDIDATINPNFFNVSIEKLLDSINKTMNKDSYDFYVGSDPVEAGILTYKNTLNSGVMIIRNTNWTKKFLQIWFNKYIPNFWLYDNNTSKWVCKIKDKMDCPWAKDAYEQGQLNLLYASNKNDEQNKICKLHWTILSNLNININSFIYHFMAHSNEQRLIYLKKLNLLLKKNKQESQ